MEMDAERESIGFNVLFVGGGPACLAGAIRLMQLARENNLELEVALIEKGAEIGSHALSGAVLNPISLKELLPDYRQRGCPVEATVRGDEFWFLTADSAYRLPVTPKYMRNKGYYVISLSRFTRWLGQIAEEMGVNMFPGFAGKTVLYDSSGVFVTGVRTGDKGLDREGNPKGNFEPGIDLTASVTVFGEGARGSLMNDIAKKLPVFRNKLPQVFETGIKEVIELPRDNYFSRSQGNDIHTLGYPLDLNTPGGGFIYEMKDSRISIGYLTGLSYEDPMLDLYDVFTRFKRHPFVSEIVRGGKVLEQGARTVSTGGYYTIPALAADGAVFVGGAAGMHHVPGLKGIHSSMKSGMLAAEAIFTAIQTHDYSQHGLLRYQELFESSWLRTELFEGRNFAAGLAKKVPAKFFHLAAQYVTGGSGVRDPLPLRKDHQSLKPASQARKPQKADVSAFDGVLYVDKLTGVFLSKTAHREDQPSHILVHDTDLCIQQCYPRYKSPCTRFCPGNVYEIETNPDSGEIRLKLNPSNCLHCKTCDIKDPYENITWRCPEGGEGPGYSMV